MIKAMKQINVVKILFFIILKSFINIITGANIT